jgi:hypothetical protein
MIDPYRFPTLRRGGEAQGCLSRVNGQRGNECRRSARNLQRQHDETQALLDGATITVFGGTSTDASAGSRVAITLLPLSSFTLARSVAARSRIGRSIPPDESCAADGDRAGRADPVDAGAGMASLCEHEVVVLGAKRPGDTVDQVIARPGERVTRVAPPPICSGIAHPCGPPPRHRQSPTRPPHHDGGAGYLRVNVRWAARLRSIARSRPPRPYQPTPRWAPPREAEAPARRDRTHEEHRPPE